jgi:ankyrin repeat protein
LYVNTCFLGGENLIKVQDRLNSVQKKIKGASSNMIFVSGATTQTVTAQSVISFANFFREFEKYLNKEEELKRLLELKESKKLDSLELKKLSILAKNFGSLRAFRSYIADNITNWVTDYSVSAIPQVRFPTTDAKFYSLASTVIDEITSGKIKLSKKFANEPETFFVDNEKILVVNVPQVGFPVIIRGGIPLLISEIGLHGFLFENIKVSDIACDLSKFIAEAITGKNKKNDFFVYTPYQETFNIKKLVLGKNTEFKDKNISLGSVLEDVFITRTGKDKVTEKECYKATFKAFDSVTGKYKYYQYIYEDNREDISQIDELAALKGKLFALFDSENIDQFKAALREAQIKDPKIINSLVRGWYTMFGMAVVKNDFEKVKILLGSGADVSKVDDWRSGILHLASENDHFDLLRYLVEIAKVDINLPDGSGETPEIFAIRHKELQTAGYLSLIRRLHKATSAPNIGLEKFSQILDETKKEFPHLLNSAAFGEAKTDTLMILAIKKNNLSMVELLLTKGSSINQVDNNRWTPLHHAAALGNFDMVKYLVEVAKANIGLKNKHGKTPRALACELKKTQVENYLSLGAKCLNDMHSDDVDWINIF